MLQTEIAQDVCLETLYILNKAGYTFDINDGQITGMHKEGEE